jgi:glycosyltransferase involved in cell wall biosynthesis
LTNSLKHIDTFIAPSRFTEKIHRRLGLTSPIVHLPYFVPAMPSAKPAATTMHKPYFLFVGRLEKLKGLQTVIPIFHQYQKAELLIAGTGEYETQLKELAGGCERIGFLGYVSGTRLEALYRNAVAVIVPSICFDVFPLVPLEAVSLKTPVIVRNLGGMPEVVEESGAGFIYDTTDELVYAMDRLLADSSYRNRLGQQGYASYKNHWTAEAHLRRYFQLIHEIAAARSPPAEHQANIAAFGNA